MDLKVQFTLNESECRALDALVGYGFEGFTQVFYAKMGEAYMKPHHEGLRTLFESVRETMPGLLSRADAARKAFNS